MARVSLVARLKGKSHALLRLPDGAALCELTLARRFLQRGVGLMARAKMPVGYKDGLLFLNCRDLHTCFMRFPLDVAFLDDTGACVEIRRGVRPWRCVRGPKSTRHVFEVTAGDLDPTDGAGWSWEALGEPDTIRT